MHRTRSAQPEAARAARISLPLARALGLGALLLFAAHGLFQFGGRGATDFFNTWVYNELQFLALAACAARTLFERRHRTAWAALTLAVGCWTAGDVYYTVELSGL